MSSISDELLAILICPETRTPLRRADANTVARVNMAITAGRLQNRGGDTLDRTIEGGLLAKGDQVLYPIVDGIPKLLADESIRLDQPALASPS
ncbi:MAG: hypothetical protein JSS27_20135 [Planctomycetes bacterium]|nr:hypothetical protein [Planctomycetota bacterium]